MIEKHAKIFQGAPQFILIDFGRIVKPFKFVITFQGGFVGQVGSDL